MIGSLGTICNAIGDIRGVTTDGGYVYPDGSWSRDPGPGVWPVPPEDTRAADLLAILARGYFEQWERVRESILRLAAAFDTVAEEHGYGDNPTPANPLDPALCKRYPITQLPEVEGPHDR